MPDLEKFVKNVMYGGIGAAASLVEKGGDLARSLGGERAGDCPEQPGHGGRHQASASGVLRRADEASARSTISKLTPEQRAELRHQLEVNGLSGNLGQGIARSG